MPMQHEPAPGAEPQNAAELFAKRLKRFEDAVQLKRPDAVPVVVTFGNLMSELAGCTKRELYENPEREIPVLERAVLELQPDAAMGMPLAPGISLELGDRMVLWPGHGIGDDDSFQVHEQEFMKASEYDELFRDPSDFAIRKFLPRMFSELEGLAMLPPVSLSLGGFFGFLQGAMIFTLPPVVKALRALESAGASNARWISHLMECSARLEKLGFPGIPFYNGATIWPPFDFIGNSLRGMKGIFLDMRRCPEKLLAAEERIIDIFIDHSVQVSRVRNVNYAHIATNRGSDGFISLRDFERFYWPQLKIIVFRLIENGITPYLSFEGVWDQRLKYLQELPKGKIIGQFQDTNLFKAKEMLGDTMCIVGGMPVSLLWGGTISEVEQYTKRICQEVGSGGGFIMYPSIGELQGCKWDLLKAWIEATREYGTY